jgi:hypothetical protein
VSPGWALAITSCPGVTVVLVMAPMALALMT